ncbi:hypothetical protein D3C71_198530 [compost metagenome]
MGRNIAGDCLLGLIVAVVSFGSQAQTGMAARGQFAVNESGAATYTIPIDVPPGTAGMTPNLSLSYNSQSGNGLLGTGWALGGLSTIGRCPQTNAQDGVRGGVNNDSNDRYCLDGQRLIAINGVYGANNTEYRTERESFSKIISYGNAGSGPAWFKVWTKAGQVMEYGNTADSRIEAQGNATAVIWALNKIGDTNGNYLVVAYTEDNANGNYYPQRIDYSGNADVNTLPMNSLHFEYEARPDVIPLYQAGSVIKNIVRLHKIIIKKSQVVVAEHELIYSFFSPHNSSQLTKIKICSNDVCLPPIDLVYENGAVLGYESPIYNTSATHGYESPLWQLTTGDVNGDGKTDVLALYNSSQGDGMRIAVMLSKGDGTYGLPEYSSPALVGYESPLWQLTTGDVNGDGKTDVLALYNSSQGDGMRIAVMLSKGDGTYGLPEYSSPALVGYQSPYWRLTKGDVNGDGKTDVIALYNSHQSGGDGMRIVVMLSNGDGAYGLPQFSSPALVGYQSPYWQLTTGDVNGDGKTDVIALYNSHQSGGDGMRIAVMLSKGDGTYAPLIFNTPDIAGYQAPYWQLRAGDVNGDGKTDVIALYNSSQGGGDGARIAVMLSKGDGTYPSFTFNTLDLTGYQAPFWQMTTGDVNGDGRMDVIGLYNSGNGDGVRIAVMKNRDTGSGLLSTIHNGFATSIFYKPISDNNFYIKDSGAFASVYPLLDVQGPLYVVSSASQSNGIGGVLTTSYKYGGLKSDIGTGRGILGFRWMEVKQSETDIVTRTEYRQDWPYTGLPLLVTKTAVGGGNGGILSEVSNNYGCQDFASSGNCTVGIGKRYFVYAQQSIESMWDLSGAALPTIVTESQYDIWGNATRISVGGGGYEKVTQNEYFNDGANWYLGRLKKAVVTSVSP